MPDNNFLSLITHCLDENKAENIQSLSVSSLTDVTDQIVIATAMSSRHASALADKVIELAKKNDHRPLGVNGKDEGEWILIDCVDIVIHIMVADTREFYSLEKLWEATLSERRGEQA